VIPTSRVQPVSEARDSKLAERLWQRSVERTGVSPDFSMMEGTTRR